MRFFLFFLMIPMICLANSYRDDFDNLPSAAEIPMAKVAHKQALQAIKDNANFDRQSAWENLVFNIQQAISQGQMSVTVTYNRKTYPEFEVKLRSKGYVVEFNGQDVSGADQATISW